VNNRILLIDDEPQILSAMVRQFGIRFDIVTALGGVEALGVVERDLAGGSVFGVTVCDMNMPGMDGIETLRRICALSPATIPIMLTGNVDQQTAINAINQGHIFRFFAKPINGALLADGIAAGLRQHELLEAERRLADNEERWRLALEAVGDGVWDWNPATDETIYSEGWWRVLGLSPVAGCFTAREWWERVHPDDEATVKAQVANLIAGRDQLFHCEHRLRLADGTYRWFLARGTVLFRTPEGAASRVIGTHVDITERRQMEETLRRQAEELALLATTDPLTGLWNRRHFLEKAEEELHRAERYGRPVSAIMIDIDHFKQVNDRFGHAAGDVVLRRFSEVVRGSLRKSDGLGRLGGEEFAVMLPESDGARAMVAAETIRREVAAMPVLLADGTELRITASFGAAAAFRKGDSVSALLGRADEALYAAKDGGRNRVVCHSDGAQRTSAM